jgi:hypothetical protein
VAFLTRNPCGLFAVVCLLAVSGIGCAGSSARGARVVWARGDRVYVASPDSVALGPGTILMFNDRGREVAVAEVTDVHDGALIAAKLIMGSFKKVKHLDRLGVTNLPPVVLGPSHLRLGYPAAGRKNLLLDCTYQSLDSSRLARIYKSQMLDARTYRLVRDLTVASPYPDTLSVRLFDEIADEEIALERGDLDVAVFWPGEASKHIREVTGWKRRADAPILHRLTATVWQRDQTNQSVALRDDEWRALERLNRELFRDDLTPAPGWDKASTSTGPGRFEVDPRLPGHEAMEGFLNRAMEASAPIDSARVVRLYYTDAFPKVRGPGGLPFENWLIVRSPVISGRKLRPYLDAIDTEPLANLFQCLPPPQKP